jgi:Flp pilus assembly pilin Flp
MDSRSTNDTGNARGAGLAEYAVLLVLIAMASIAILTTLGITILEMFIQAVDAF